MRVFAIVVICALAASSAFAGTQGKKLIEYGWDCPDTQYVREHIREMEKVPFDGVIIRVHRPGENATNGFGWQVFGKRRFEPKDYDYAIADLKATKFKRFTDNFIQIVSAPGDIDWFDPQWPAVAHNAACLAGVARQTGCKGIMFDPEMYTNYKLWGYRLLPKDCQANHTFKEYTAKVRQRGREFIRAINREFPDLTVLCLYGMSMSYMQSRAYQKTDLIDTDYSLLPAFYDGICEAATPGTVLVDGYEWSYGYRERKQFVDGRDLILHRARTLSANPKAFTKHVRAGFGIWADWDSNRVGWHTDDFTKNYFTPAGLRASLNYAMETSDRYVWVYSERFKWWPPAYPKEYADALRLARLGPGPGEKHPLKLAALVPKAANIPGYSDAETFAEMRKTMTEVLDLPRDGWKFARDKKNSGVREGWQKPGFDDSAWRSIEIGKFWEEQGEDYDGRAWYRRSFAVPSIEPGKRIFLAFGAADETARVWLNDQFVGEHDVYGGWDKSFTMEITRQLKPGATNSIAVQVLDRVNAGGLWKPIKVMVK